MRNGKGNPRALMTYASSVASMLCRPATYRIGTSPSDLVSMRLLLVSLLAAALTLPACSIPARDQVGMSLYPIIDSGTQADYGQRSVYWLDNSRVLFLGYPPDWIPAAAPRDRALYVWDVDRNKVELFARGRVQCFSRGYIRWVTNTIRSTTPEGRTLFAREHREGPVGKEAIRRVTWLEGEKDADLTPLDPGIVCEMDNQLYPEHGRLDLRWGRRDPSSDRGLVPWYRPDAAQPVLLPFDRLQVSAVRYYPFADTYLITSVFMEPSGVRSSPYPPGPQPLWLFKPDGTLTELQMPDGPWRHGSMGFHLTRQGVFFWSHATGVTGGPGAAGGYLVRGEKVTKIITGKVMASAASPDGCKIAFAYTEDSFSMQKGVPAKAINLCAKE